MSHRKKYKKALRGNIWKSALFSITQRRVYWPILTVYFLSFPNNELRQIGIFMAVGQIAGIFLELPSGYLSDKMGHKNALVLSKVLLTCATIAYLVGGSFPVFAIGSICFAVGVAFTSGTQAAFMHETLSELKIDHLYSKIMSRTQSITLLISAGLLAIIPLTASISLRTPIAIGLVIEVIGIMTVLSLVVPKRTKKAILEVSTTNFKGVMREVNYLHVLPIIIFPPVVNATVMASSSYRDVYQQFIGIEVVYLGILFSLSRVVASLLGFLIFPLKHLMSVYQFYFIRAAILISGLFLVGRLENKWAVASAFIVMIGVLWAGGPVARHYKLELIRKSKFKATILSLGGLVKNIIFATLMLLIGYMIDRFGFVQGYQYYSWIALGFTAVAYVVLLNNKKHVKASK